MQKTVEYTGDAASESIGLLSDVSELVGLTLGDALKIANKEGYCIDSVTITAPPKLKIFEYDQSFRVLRVQILEDKRLTILVCKPL
ncbi:hypothetical protein LY28_01251 [Ruminiclostridium sufflavum DSM 19573]|uniref:Uncharacterized protein n=1 Tax=Ruminiclostridium sufflavum DSM 19573 TaxID=1121337 RepID=A0A318XL93_9FIRM|nr:hypothetical protein [Ruminiclostridium sufflavum]PYG88403.1 hypothetical protein LY28_01251 [Ruminiclostridium sufflavum DSM 19573]